MQIVIVSAQQVVEPKGAPAKEHQDTSNDLCQCTECTNREDELGYDETL